MTDLRLSTHKAPRRKSDPQPWHNADIVAAVRKAGSNLRQLSLANGFKASTFRSALHRCHPRANRLIADFIGVRVHEIWPQWFMANGERKPVVSIGTSRGHSAPSTKRKSTPAAQRAA